MLMTRGVGAAFEPAGEQLVARVEQSRVCASLWGVWPAVWPSVLCASLSLLCASLSLSLLCASLSLLCASLSLLQSRVCASLVGAAFEPAGDQLVARVEQSRVCASLSVARASLSVIWAWSSVGASQMSP